MSNPTALITSQQIADAAVDVMAEEAVFTRHVGTKARAYWESIRGGSGGGVKPGYGWEMVFDGQRALSGSTSPSTDTRFTNTNRGNTLGQLITDAGSAHGVANPTGGATILSNTDYQRLGEFKEGFKFNFFKHAAVTYGELEQAWFHNPEQGMRDICEDLVTQIDLTIATEARNGGTDALPPVLPGDTDFSITSPDGQKNIPVAITQRIIAEAESRLLSLGWVRMVPGSFKMFSDPMAMLDLATIWMNLQLPRELVKSTAEKGFTGVINNIPFYTTNHIEPHECGTRQGFYRTAVDSDAKRGRAFGNTARATARPNLNALGDFRGNNVTTTGTAAATHTGLVNGSTATAEPIFETGSAAPNFLHEQTLVLDGLYGATDTFKAGDHFVIEGVYAVNRTTRKRQHLRVFTVLDDATAASNAVTLNIHPRIVSGSAYQNCDVAAIGSTIAAGTLDNRKVQFLGRSGASYGQFLGYDDMHMQTAFGQVVQGAAGANQPLGGVDYGVKGLSQSGVIVSVLRDFQINTLQSLVRMDTAFMARSVGGANRAVTIYGRQLD